MVQRLTYRTRHSYATKSNQHRVVKTPGGKLVYQTTKKRASGPKCPVTGKRIQGVVRFLRVVLWVTYMGSLQIPHLRPAEYKRSRLPRNRRTVNRAYGGVLSCSAVRESSGVWRLSLIQIRLFSKDNSSLLGGRAENCEEGSEDPEVQGKASFKELRN
ncbi:hypothetical protein Gohar_028138 [Gossypium harknessii]|uniref:60S ribosomal protein L34 n=1 Tax=Gossypium harknessii TaxID=34285 RepID=A0A7J9IB73_9ROSI|nr:hypothetical protein [Gossypium harknessii]